ncbi:MAG: YkgJ family cysteine cluster protein [Pseudomonadota bacterium]
MTGPTTHLERCVQAAHALGVDLKRALDGLHRLQQESDRALTHRSDDLSLPCHAGCDACCTSSPRITPLEYLALVHELQVQHALEPVRERSRALMRELGPRIQALPGFGGSAPLDQKLQFRCPVLDANGQCGCYATRPLVCRLFGHSFDDKGDLYGCDLVRAHLRGRELTLPRAQPWLQRLRALPLTEMVQVIPYYTALFDDG